MEVKTCKRCNKMFQYIGGKQICPRCRQKEEELFQTVKAYLRENVGASTEEVCEATGATMAMIQGFLREGRLEVTADSPIAITCEQCGVKIRSGRFCDKCKNHLSNGLQDAAKSLKTEPAKEEREKERMRFLNKVNKDK